MAFQLPPLQFSSSAGGAGPLGANSSVGTPVNITLPWNQTKNYQNHTSGSSQSATSSADPVASASTSGGGLDMKWVLAGAAAWLLLS